MPLLFSNHAEKNNQMTIATKCMEPYKILKRDDFNRNNLFISHIREMIFSLRKTDTR